MPTAFSQSAQGWRLLRPGAHTYERGDQPRGEFFHTNWTGTGGRVASSTYTV
ncbi:MAG: hypothetical protein KIS67_18885 [Verrucomicrobiae bacterium]|nr:hypothetical protein [Verrucomicrobiae bacterium]